MIGQRLRRAGALAAVCVAALAAPLHARVATRHAAAADSAATIVALRDSASRSIDAHRFAAARSLLERAIAWCEARGPAGDTARAGCLVEMARWKRLAGDAYAGGELARRALAIDERLFDSAAVLRAQLELSACALATGDVENARRHIERARSGATLAYGAESPRLAEYLIQQSEVDAAVGDEAASRVRLERAVDLLRRAPAPDAEQLASALTALGDRDRRHDAAGALALYDDAIATLRRAGAVTARLLDVQSRRAVVLGALGRYAEAEVTMDSVGAYQAPDDAVAAVEAIERQGDAAYANGHVLKARACYAYAMELAFRLEARDRPRAETRLESRSARVDRDLGDRASALRRALEAAGSASRALWQTSMPLRRSDVRQYASSGSAALRLALSMTVDSVGIDGGERRGVYAALVRSRDRSPRDRRSTRDVDPAGVTASDPAREPLAALVAALPPGTALVSYARFDRVASRREGSPGMLASTPTYLAFVLAGSRLDVVDLGAAAAVDPLAARWQALAATAPPADTRSATRAEAECARAGAALRRQVWDPVAAHLGDARRVFVVADGALCALDLAALPATDGGYLADGARELHGLMSELDLLGPPRESRPGAGLLAMGGPDFDAPPVATGSSPAPSTPSPRRDRARLDPMPDGRREAQSITDLWRGSGPVAQALDTRILTGAAATERAFRDQASGRRCLHVATRLIEPTNDSAPPSDTGDDGDAASADDFAWSADSGFPVDLGLAMAGANVAGPASPAERDGMLSAEEIGWMPLESVQWVVLSGCAPHDAGGARNVFDLARAFHSAGARAVIAPLWAPDDDDAREWLQDLYEARLARGLDTATAVHDAQRRLLAARRARRLSTHPYYWAAYTAMGDWR